MTIKLKRIYEPLADQDGYRVLIDRLWPRGVSKERGACDEWLKEIAPSAELRNWFHHDPARFDEFRVRYEAELAGSTVVETLRQLLTQRETVTLLFAAADLTMNQAVVLRDYMRAHRA